jgi:hypothetical protein
MSGEGVGREIAGTLHADAPAPAPPCGVTEPPESLPRETRPREPDNAAVDDRRGAETLRDTSAPAAGISP